MVPLSFNFGLVGDVYEYGIYYMRGYIRGSQYIYGDAGMLSTELANPRYILCAVFQNPKYRIGQPY